MIKFDENKNITEEYKNYVSNLEREELEIMYIGADAYVDRLNNVLNELKEWFKEFHKYQSRLKWNEKDYIEFIEHLENELKESDK